MARLRGISNRFCSIALCGVLLTGALTGCAENHVGDGIGDTPLSGTFADMIKPDVNREGRLLLDPGLVAADFTDTDFNPWSPVGIGEDFGSGDESGGTEDGSGGGSGEGIGGDDSDVGSAPPAETWKRIVDPSTFPVPTVPVVNASVYGDYLKEYVYDPVNTVLRSHNDVYFRVFHMGYDTTTTTVTYSKPTGGTEPVSTVTHTVPGTTTNLKGCRNSTCSAVAGDAHTYYMIEWLGGLDVNQTLHNPENNRASFKTSIANVVGSADNDVLWSSTYDSIVGTDEAKLLGSKVMTIWEKFKDQCPQLGNLAGQVDDNNWGAIPDLTLKYYKKATALNSVVMNGVTRNSTHTASGGTATSVVDVLFTNYNQFHTREFVGIERWGTNAYVTTASGATTSYLATYTDGYHRTVIYIAAEEGKTLNEVLGEDFDVIMTTLSTAKAPTDITYFTETLGMTDDFYVPATDVGKGEF